MIWAYLRVSTDKQDLANQKLLILDWANQNGVRVERWLEISISSRKSTAERKIDELLSNLKEQDTLVISELSRLGRSTSEVINIINQLIEKKVNLIIIKQNLNLKPGNKQDIATKVMITIFSLLAEVERDLISERTKMGIERARAEGKTIGRPKGKLGESKLEKKKDLIIELLNKGVSKTSIAKILECSPSTLYHFLYTRKIIKAKGG